MRRDINVPHSSFRYLSLGLTALGLLFTPLANAQTPVSARMNISGSCASCDLSNRVMPRLSLQGSDFSGSNFAHSNMSGGKFHGSNLMGASFNKAYLMRVEGDHINMEGVNFRDATLIEVKLISANITHADLHRADLTNGDFSKSAFNYSKIVSADAVGARFVNADLSNTHLAHSDFTNADFTHAIFEKTNFGDAILAGAVINNARLHGAGLSTVQGLTQAQLDQACGDTETKLPIGFSIKQCAAPLPQSVQTASIAPLIVSEDRRANLSPQHPVAAVVSIPIAPPLMAPPLENTYKLGAAEKQSSIDLALVEIEATLRDLPISSPLHKRLTKSRILLQQAQTNGPK